MHMRMLANFAFLPLLAVPTCYSFGIHPRQANKISEFATATALVPGNSTTNISSSSSGAFIDISSTMSALTNTVKTNSASTADFSSASTSTFSSTASSYRGFISDSSGLSASANFSNPSSTLTGRPSSTGAGNPSIRESSETKLKTISPGLPTTTSTQFPKPGLTERPSTSRFVKPSQSNALRKFRGDKTSSILHSSSTGATIVPIIITATDGSKRSTVVTWSAVDTSTSTRDNKNQPTIISPPFFVCNDPFCIRTGCVLAIFCSSDSGKGGSGGFPPPSPPPRPPPGPPPEPHDNRPSGSVTESLLKTDSISIHSTTSFSPSTASSTTYVSISTVVDPGPTSVGDPDDGSRRRARRGEILVPREIPIIKEIGSCALPASVNIPLYLSYSGAMNMNKQPNANNKANGKMYNAIEKWYAENLAIDGVPFLGVKMDNGFKPATGPGSIDHVWEKSNVGDFLKSSMDSDFDCDDLRELFFPSCPGIDILQRIFDQLPSMDPKNIQTGFAAMNRNLNGMKGWMFLQGFSKDGFSSDRFKNIYNTNEKTLQALERQAIIFNFFNTDEGIQSMHDQTNNRIYQAFLGLDKYISTKKIQRASERGDLTKKFGPLYKAWYEKLLSDTGSETYSWASSQVSRLQLDPSVPDNLKKGINAFISSPLYGRDKFQIDQSHLSWKDSPLDLGIFAKRGLCQVATSTPKISSSSTTPSTILSPPPSSTSTQTTTPKLTTPPRPESTTTPPPKSSPPPPSSPTVAPADPPTSPSCAPTPSHDIKDSHKGELEKAVSFFCNKYASNTVTTSHVNIAQTIISGTVNSGFRFGDRLDIARDYTGSDNKDDVYDISVKSVDACTPGGGYHLNMPVSDHSCDDILKSAWNQCNNKGRGGSIVAGCLVYSLSTRY